MHSNSLLILNFLRVNICGDPTPHTFSAYSLARALRSGWLYGRGRCWWVFGSRSLPYSMLGTITANEQIKALETYKKDLETTIKEINMEIERLKKKVLGKTEKEK